MINNYKLFEQTRQIVFKINIVWLLNISKVNFHFKGYNKDVYLFRKALKHKSIR